MSFKAVSTAFFVTILVIYSKLNAQALITGNSISVGGSVSINGESVSMQSCDEYGGMSMIAGNLLVCKDRGVFFKGTKRLEIDNSASKKMRPCDGRLSSQANELKVCRDGSMFFDGYPLIFVEGEEGEIGPCGGAELQFSENWKGPVIKGARVSPDTTIDKDSSVCDPRVYIGSSKIENSHITGSAQIFASRISNTNVFGSAQVTDSVATNSEIFGRTQILDSVIRESQIFGDTVVSDSIVNRGQLMGDTLLLNIKVDEYEFKGIKEGMAKKIAEQAIQ